jgi:AmpD protein
VSGPLHVDADGWVVGTQWRPSANADDRPPEAAVELLVLHNISVPPGQFGTGCIHQLFGNTLVTRADPLLEQLAGLRVSAHFLIERDGRVSQFVSCWRRAWHAGASSFEGRAACNDYSVGVELEGTDFIAFEAQQYAALARLTIALRSVLPLRAARGHSDIAPGRKTDPGPLFDWSRYARAARLPDAWLLRRLGTGK